MFDLRREARRWALLTTFALSLGAATSAQGYYDDEEWWDVTEWFDGNDYEYQEYDDDDYDVDQDWNDMYGYGYDTRYDHDDWFYDYYDGVYSTYTDYGDGVYGYATRYYDFDDDGFYDAFYTYNDWDGDGFYEDVDYHAIDDSSERSSSKRSAQPASDTAERSQDASKRSQDGARRSKAASSGSQEAGRSERERNRSESSRYALDGEIVKKKKVSVRDTKQLVVKLETTAGEAVLADLGPVSELDDFDLMTGDRIAVRGPKTSVGEHKILVAQELRANGGSFQSVKRESRCVKGHVADTRNVTVEGEDRLLAIVRTDTWKHSDDRNESNDAAKKNAAAKKWLVDLGPASDLGIKLSQGQAIEVRGIPCKKDDRRILVATSLTRGENELEIDRRPAMRPMSPSRSSTEAGYHESTSRTKSRGTR